MKLCPQLPCCAVILAFALAMHSQAAGPINRVANTTLQLPLNPPTFGFTSADALGLIFTNPVCIVTPPGETNRLFILEKRGRVIVITNLAAPTRTLFMDITSRVRSSSTIGEERGLLGLAFHPGYHTNRYFYLFYTRTNGSAAVDNTNTLARFETSESNPNQGVANSELQLIAQTDQAFNHNGGDLHFGPDAYLYVSLGDEGDANDSRQNSQRITKDFFSGIIRIDVDKRPGSLPPNPHPAIGTPANYAVPPDNPFVGATNFNGFTVNSNLVRTEFWAVGLRNPWRYSFDPLTGTLYCGDVGQDTREEISIIEKGKNYGWNYWEGFFRRTNSPPPGFVHTPPIYDYPRGGSAAVTGGIVYRGHRLSQLHGAYIFADYVQTQVRALRHVGNTVTENNVIFNDGGIVAFGVDPRDGDVLYADVGGANGTGSVIKRINYSTMLPGASLPPTLADTGAFADLGTLAPQAGIEPYDLNVPFWSDNAIKSRWFSLPNTNLTVGFNPDGNWSFPTGAVWIKHFELELTNGVPESRKRLETRFIVKNAAGVYGITYRWGDSLTNATLVPEAGLDENFVIDEGGGILHTQVWHYPSRVECNQCHTEAGGFALGFNTAQLNRDFDYASATTNQVAALSLAGYFNTDVSDVRTLRVLAHQTNSAVSLEYRVRSYLAANCSQCHQPGGPAHGALWDARITTTTPNAGIINGPLGNNEGNPDVHVITPGSLTNSMLLTRISKRGPGQMPPLASTVLDTQAVALVSEWISNALPGYQSFADWQIAFFGSTNSTDASPDADPDGDGANNRLEQLTGTSPTNSLDAWVITAALSNDIVQVSFDQIANRAFEVQHTTNLFDSDSWSLLDVPGNEPFFSITNRTAIVPDSVLESPEKYYRVRVIEP